METYIGIFIILGLIGVGLPWLLKLFKTSPVNIPMLALSSGILLYLLPLNLPDPDPKAHQNVILKLSELAVIISLMGAGLKLDKPFSLKNYKIPFLLVFITMMGCIAATSGMAFWLGFVPASALLLGAVFAPTDPVIATDLQVDLEEGEEDEHPVRFALTAEAGMNDGMAFPFTWLAVWAAMEGIDQLHWAETWILKDLIYRILAGLVSGYFLGRAIAWLYFTLPKKVNFNPSRLGFLAIAATLAVYGITEAINGYGFIAVFVAAITIRQSEKKQRYHKEMHDVITQTEQYFTIIILLLLGGYIVNYWGASLTWNGVLLALVFLFIIRPVFGILPTLGSSLKWRDRWMVSFMGIKGIGSLFYLAFALHETFFPQQEQLWGTITFLIVTSIFVHGVVAYFLRPYLGVEDES